MAEDNCHDWLRVGCALSIVRIWWICVCARVSTKDSRAVLPDGSDLHTISDDHGHIRRDGVLIMRFAYANHLASSIFMRIA